ncbi:hypothetical protein [Xylanibacter muris]|uniref:TonB-dependent receptor plug domain-containing protein n=1 Tax=Xylanibacter muris TaxID=2736290 RepID=A0ABX2APC2_9BACT|nr:hypothetical protein [Xylanibacter muris]NPD93098.1 hypothetical protein [Xylanibacter muris]
MAKFPATICCLRAYKKSLTKVLRNLRKMRFLIIMFSIFSLCVNAQESTNDTTVVNGKTLNEIVVKAKYMRQKNNGDIILQIAGNPLAEGKPLSQVLNYIPGVISKDGNVSINGLDGTVFLHRRETK